MYFGRKDWGCETPEDRQKEIEIKDNLNKHIAMQQALFDVEVFSKFTPKSFDQTDNLLLSLLINSEEAVFKSIKSSMSSMGDCSSLKNQELMSSARRIERLFNALTSANLRVEHDIECKLSLIEDIVDNTHREVMQYLDFSEKMKHWSLQFFSDPKKCTLNPFNQNDADVLESVNSFEQHQNSIADVDNPAISINHDEPFEQDYSSFTTQVIEDEFNRLIAICLEASQHTKTLLDIRHNNGDLDDYIDESAAQRKYFLSLKFIWKSRVEDWVKWQMRMISYIQSSLSSLCSSGRNTLLQEKKEVGEQVNTVLNQDVMEQQDNTNTTESIEANQTRESSHVFKCK